ncbi:hypothetical protein GCM10009525_48210 [Streptosporangium amethystogenes subsp. fukuiense]
MPEAGAGKGVSPASLRAARYYSHPGVDAPPIPAIRPAGPAYDLLRKPSGLFAREPGRQSQVDDPAADVHPASGPRRSPDAIGQR